MNIKYTYVYYENGLILPSFLLFNTFKEAENHAKERYKTIQIFRIDQAIFPEFYAQSKEYEKNPI